METWKIKEYQQPAKDSTECRYGKYINGKCTNISNANFGLFMRLKFGKYGFCTKDKCPIKVEK